MEVRIHSSIVAKATRILSEAKRLVSQGLDRESAIETALSKVTATPSDKAFARRLWASMTTILAAINSSDYQAQCHGPTTAFDAAQEGRPERAMKRCGTYSPTLPYLPLAHPV